jgi:hypothetical protein
MSTPVTYELSFDAHGANRRNGSFRIVDVQTAVWIGNRLISNRRVGSPDRARDAIDLVAATVDSSPMAVFSPKTS